MRILKKIIVWLFFIFFMFFMIPFLLFLFDLLVHLLYGFYGGYFHFDLKRDMLSVVRLVTHYESVNFIDDFSANMSTWFAAFGTIAAVVVAIFKNSFVKWYERPKLNVSIDDNKGDSPCYRNVQQFYAGRRDSICNSFFLRIRVRNKGLSVAENVQVFAKQINTYSCDSGEEKSVDYLAMDMVWANSGDDFFPRIYPNSERYCDIALILDPDIRGFDRRYYFHQQWSGKYKEKEPALCIQVRYPLGSGDHIKGPGMYGLHVVVSGKDVEPINKEIIINTCDFKSWPDRDQDAKEQEKEIRGMVKFCVYQNWWHKNVRRGKELISKAPFKMQSCD